MNLNFVKNLFAGFIRTRGMHRHFRRFAILEALTRTGVTRELPPSLAQTLTAAARTDGMALLRSLGSDPDGLGPGGAGLSVCTRVPHGDDVEPRTPALLARVREVTTALNEDGLRGGGGGRAHLAAGSGNLRHHGRSGSGPDRLRGFLDPPKKTTAPALRALGDHGVAVKILTGDNERVTAKICRQVGIAVDAVLLGADVEAMNDGQLAVAVERTNVLAKLTPDHKERIVRVLRRNGHVVGFIGDGINDAPALRAADIGISTSSSWKRV